MKTWTRMCRNSWKQFTTGFDSERTLTLERLGLVLKLVLEFAILAPITLPIFLMQGNE